MMMLFSPVCICNTNVKSNEVTVTQFAIILSSELPVCSLRLMLVIEVAYLLIPQHVYGPV